VRTVEAYRDKLAGLRDTLQALVEREQVRLIAFQEVRSEDAVRAVLGRLADRFDVCAARHNAFQTLAFAWDKSLSTVPGACTTHMPLAVLDAPGDGAAQRRVRPGLALELNVNGARVTFMNVHLKAGCASVTQSQPRFPGRLLTDPVQPCEVFNRQVPLFEDWIEAVASRSPRFVILGDFNRRIDDEKALSVARDQVRADASDPAGRHVKGADGRVSTRYLWPEIDDGSPALFQLPLSATDAGCKGFTGLDHIVLSASLHAALARHDPAAIAARKVAVAGRAGQAIETSDHCPQIGQLLL
jgi:endonuclease/exonuclease/phosphatase family metal-dependent hydrolase